MPAKNKTIAIRARRAFLARRCNQDMNITRGASHTQFPRNTLRRAMHSRYQQDGVAPIVEEATREEILAYCANTVPTGQQAWGSAA
jgi:hypothetical protein